MLGLQGNKRLNFKEELRRFRCIVISEKQIKDTRKRGKSGQFLFLLYFY